MGRRAATKGGHELGHRSAQPSSCLQHGLTPVSQELGGNIQLVAQSGHGCLASATQKNCLGRTTWTSA